MRSFRIIIIVVCFILTGLSSEARAQTSTRTKVDSLVQEFNRVNIRLDTLSSKTHYEIQITRAMIDGIRQFLVIIPVSISVIGLLFTVFAFYREHQYRKDYKDELKFYQDRISIHEHRQEKLYTQLMQMNDNSEARNNDFHSQSKMIVSGTSKNVEILNEMMQAFSAIIDLKKRELLDNMDKVSRYEEIIERDETNRKRLIDELKNDAINFKVRRFDLRVLAENIGESERKKALDSIRNRLERLLDDFDFKSYIEKNIKERSQWEYGAIFCYGGIAAFVDNKIERAIEFLTIAEQFLDPTQSDAPKHDRMFLFACTLHYIARIYKNYGNLDKAKEKIDLSYTKYALYQPHEVIIPTLRMEIISYMENTTVSDLEEELKKIKDQTETLRRVRIEQPLKYKEDPYDERATTCLIRAYLLLGNKYFITEKYNEALESYEAALRESKLIKRPNYYASYSIAQIKHRQKVGIAEVLERIVETYEYLERSNNLKTKCSKDSQILLHALAFLCARYLDQHKDGEYKQRMEEYNEKLERLIKEASDSNKDLELRPYSLQRKCPVFLDVFWKDLNDNKL